MALSVVTDYTALLSGSYWGGIEVTGTPVVITYSFPTAAPAYLSGVDGFSGATISSFQAFNAAEQAQARAALGEWAAASGLVFVQVAPGQGDINFQLVDLNTTPYSGAGGIGFYPFGSWNNTTYPSFSSDLDSSGDVFMNSQYAGGGTVNYGTLLHEIGHAIGLKHPTQTVIDHAPEPDVRHDQVLSSDDPARTIMATVGDSSGAPDHLRALDQQAAAFIYGPAGTGRVVTTNATGSNSILSSWSWNAAKQRLTETGFATDDTIRGSSVTDVINGFAGNDRLFGLNGNDQLNGGDGNDFLDGGPGIDRLTGGIGDDTYVVDAASDKIFENGDEGFDSVLSSVSFKLSDNIELLQLFGSGLSGSGNALANTLYGDGVNATKLYGYGGADYIVGGAGNDIIDGGTEIDQMYGGAGNDTYYVDNSADIIGGETASGGTDKVYATTSYSITPGEYIEYLYAKAGTGAISLTGNEQANRIYGGIANDTLDGGAGVDTLYGGSGDDRLIGGQGLDALYGQEGADTFVLTKAAADRDTIRDFMTGNDRLEISAAMFGAGVIAGSLDPARFEANATGTATTMQTRFAYNTGSGALYFDADGSGAAARQQIATLTGAPTLTAGSFDVV